MRRMQRAVREADIYARVESFLGAAIGRGLTAFAAVAGPLREEIEGPVGAV